MNQGTQKLNITVGTTELTDFINARKDDELICLHDFEDNLSTESVNYITDLLNEFYETSDDRYDEALETISGAKRWDDWFTVALIAQSLQTFTEKGYHLITAWFVNGTPTNSDGITYGYLINDINSNHIEVA